MSDNEEDVQEILHELTRTIQEYRLVFDRIVYRALAREARYIARVEPGRLHPEIKDVKKIEKELNEAIATAEIRLYGRSAYKDE